MPSSLLIESSILYLLLTVHLSSSNPSRQTTDLHQAAAKKRKLQIEMEHATAGAIGPAWAAGGCKLLFKT